MDRIRLGNVVASGQRLPVPAIAKSDGKQGIAALDHMLPGGHGGTLGRDIVVAVDHPDATAWGTGTTSQQGTEGKTDHQSLKACCSHVLSNDRETHPPLPLWWLKNGDASQGRNITQV